MRVRILAGIALCGALVASAQTTSPATSRSISLPECIRLALTRNLDLQIEHLSADITRYNLSGSYGVYAPVLSFSARHDSIDQPGDFDPQKFNQDFPYLLKTDTAGPGLNGRLPFGLSYDFQGRAGERTAATDFNSDFDDARNFPWGIRKTNDFFAEASLTVQQHLLKDFWIDQDRLTVLLRRKDLKISQQSLRFQIMRILLAVECAYYDLAAARQRIRVEESSLQLRQQLVAETRRRVQVGDLPPLDSDQAETQLQITLTALSAAREAYQAQQNAFKNLITDNFREWADIELLPSDALLAIRAEINRSESFQNALKNRPDLVEARLAVEKSDVTVQFRFNQLFPTVDLIGRYGGLGSQADSTYAMSDALHFRNSEYFYGVVMSVPLGSISERNSYLAGKSSKKIAELQLKKAEQDVLVQVADWSQRVQSRFSQVGSSRQARTFADAALAAEQKKLQNGLSTAFFVLQLQDTLTSAQMAEIQALADYNKALAQLAFADARILEQNQITIEVH